MARDATALHRNSARRRQQTSYLQRADAPRREGAVLNTAGDVAGVHDADACCST